MTKYILIKYLIDICTKKCSICGYDIYMFELSEFKEHGIECYKFNYICQRQVRINENHRWYVFLAFVNIMYI